MKTKCGERKTMILKDIRKNNLSSYVKLTEKGFDYEMNK